MQTTVYLNTTRDAGFGFANPFTPPAVKRAIDFDLPLDYDQPHVFDRALEQVFEQLNIGGDLVPATDWTLRYRNARNRSLSVGDVVVLGEMAYAVADMGFERITTDDLTSALARTGERDEYVHPA